MQSGRTALADVMDHQPAHRIDIDGMPENPGKRAEWVAERLIPRWLGADFERVDVLGGPPGRVDFEIRYSDGRRGALEVRACVDRAAREFEKALDQLGSTRPAEGLSRWWHVLLREEVRIAGRHDALVPVLMSLESMGYTASAAPAPPSTSEFYLVRGNVEAIWAPEPPDEVRQLHEVLGVVNAWSFEVPPGEQPAIELARRSRHSGAGREHLVTAEVERAAAEKIDVLSTVDALACDERHLFVWLGTKYCFEAEAGLWAGYCRDAPAPKLPEPITQAWVAGWSLTPGHGLGHVIAWKNERGASWEIVE